MELNKRMLILAKIASKQPGIGKTAMMKCVYLLQTIEDVPFGYEFEIYTYGPFSSSVTDEIDFARQKGYLSISSTVYPEYVGYNINCGNTGRQALNEENDYQYDEAIDSILSVFGSKTARELELLSTILFVSCTYVKNSTNSQRNDICDTVSKIKPRFEMREISNGYDFMQSKGYLYN